MGECYGTFLLDCRAIPVDGEGCEMGYTVGVDVGSTLTSAAIATQDDTSPFSLWEPEMVAVVPSVVFLGEDSDLVLGDRAEELGSANPNRVVRDFKRRVGDSVPVIIDDWRGQAETIVAAVVRLVVDDIAGRAGSAPEAIAVTHPAGWGAYRRDLLSGALQAVGLQNVMLFTEPAAAAGQAVPMANLEVRTVAVYDLGGGSFDATVLTRAEGAKTTSFELIGRPHEIDSLGGCDFDQAVFTRVQALAGLRKVDVSGDGVLAGILRLRRDCVVAKQALSLDTEATITVVMPLWRTRVRLVRSEFEELIREAIEDTLDAMHRTIASAGLAADDIDAIVLAGGSSRIPLVAQMVSAEFARPIIVDNNPGASISLGAAGLAAAAVQAKRAVPAPQVEQPAAPPAQRLVPELGPADEPADEPAESEQSRASATPLGRHRRRSGHRWLRAAVVASLAGVVFLIGPSMAATQTSDKDLSGGDTRANGSTGVTTDNRQPTDRAGP